MRQIILRDLKCFPIKAVYILFTRLNISLWKCIKLVYKIMKGKQVIIQSYKDSDWIIYRIEFINYCLFDYFKSTMDYKINNMFFSQISRSTHDLVFESYAKGFKIFVEK